MNLLTGYKSNKAISILIVEGSLTSPEGRQAAASLRRLGADAIPKLLDALAGSENTTVLEKILMEFVNDETLELLTNSLGCKHVRVDEAIVNILARSKSYDPNKLLKLLENPAVSTNTIGQILINQKSRLDVKKLLLALDKVTGNTRPIIYRLLDASVTEEFIPIVVAKTQSEEPLVRTYLATLLAKFDNKSAKQTLTQMLGDPNKAVRQASLAGLAKLKAVDSIELICHCLSDPDMTVQTSAIESLCKINAPDTIKYLIEVLQDESEYVRRAAVEVLNEIGDQSAIKDLLNALRDADWWVKVRAADALGSIGGPKVFEAVLALIKDPDEFMRRTAVEILNTSKDIKAFDKLVEALNDADWWVRERAADALAGLGDKRAVLPLLAMLNRSPEASQVVLRALTAIGDTTAIDPIMGLLYKQDKNTQKDALTALKQLTDEAHRNDVEHAVTQLIESPFREVGIIAEETVQSFARRFGNNTSKIISNNTSGSMEPINLETSSELALQHSSANIQMLDASRLKAGDMFANRYRVIKHVGKGAFGIVILVEDVVVHDQFILKILNPHVSNDEYNIKRFTQELRYARKITHENVIRIYDFIKHNRSYAISMEYFPSHSLRWEISQRETLNDQHMIGIMLEICDGMSAAHNAGVVHRDLKPGNILVDDNFNVKIVDFGLAAAASHGDSRLTKTGLLVGTPTYMAPEQVRGGKIDPRTDIYSLGIIMYELFTGEPPYRGDDSLSVMFQHVEANPVPPKKINPKISTEMEKIILKAMSADPIDRFQSFSELKNSFLALKLELA